MRAQGTTSAAVDRAGNSDGLEHLARVGLIAYGVVHLLVAWLALQLAWGGGGQSADQSGALATVAGQPFGKPLLWVIALGLIALAVWQAAEALRWRGALSADGKQKKRRSGRSSSRSRRRSSMRPWPSPRSSSPSAAGSPARSSSSSARRVSSPGPAAGGWWPSRVCS